MAEVRVTCRIVSKDQALPWRGPINAGPENAIKCGEWDPRTKLDDAVTIDKYIMA
jgi:hypothetical protein